MVTDGIAKIKKLNMGETSSELDIEIDPNAAQHIARCLASLVLKSPNYTEVKFDLSGPSADKFEWVIVLVQKGKGKTPHQLRLEAEKECSKLRAILNEKVSN